MAAVGRVFARLVEQAGRQLPFAHAHRVPVLLDQQHPVVVVDREHRDGARVVDVLPGDRGAVVAEAVPAHAPDAAVEDEVAAGDRREGRLILQREDEPARSNR